MNAQQIDGKALAQSRRQELITQVESFIKQHSVTPSLHVILVGDHTASQIYVKNKQRACYAIGMQSTIHHLSADTKQKEITDLIDSLNTDPKVHGILLQLPLPNHLDAQTILEWIHPLKDVDGLHPYNLGRLLMNKSSLVPCTPLGCLQLIKTVCPNIEGENVVVVGRSLLVGKSLAMLLTNQNATVTLAHSKTKNLKCICKAADILICAIGSSEFFTSDYIKPGAIVIDVGINRIEKDGVSFLKGDVHQPSVEKVAGYLTPVPGGVGPMTISNLLSNTLKAANLLQGLPI